PPPISTLFPYTTLFRSMKVIFRRSAAGFRTAELGLDAAQLIGRQFLRIYEAEDQGLGRAAKEPRQKVTQEFARRLLPRNRWLVTDRKSTRLNSSHVAIS